MKEPYAQEQTDVLYRKKGHWATLDLSPNTVKVVELEILIVAADNHNSGARDQINAI